MKSCRIRAGNEKTALELRDIPAPQPGPGEIVLRVRAPGLNRGQPIAGSVMHGGALKLGGTEDAGEVCAPGEGGSGVRAGDRVTGRALGRGRGTFAEYAAMDARQAMPVPARAWRAYRPASRRARASSAPRAPRRSSQNSRRSASTSASGRAPRISRRGREATGRGADLAVNCVGGSMFSEGRQDRGARRLAAFRPGFGLRDPGCRMEDERRGTRVEERATRDGGGWRRASSRFIVTR